MKLFASPRRVLVVGAAVLSCVMLFLCLRTRTREVPAEGGPSPVESEEPPAAARWLDHRTLPRPSRASRRLQGRVEGPRSTPIVGASVCIAELPRERAPRCGWSDSAGRFGIEAGEKEGTAGVLYVSAVGYQSLRQNLASVPVGPLILTLLEGSAAITGTVSDASGGPIAGAIVRATSEFEDKVLAVALSSQDGRFRMDPPSAERIVLVDAEAEGYSGLPNKTSTPARGLQLVLSAASGIVGRVLHASSREPAAGVEVLATATGWPWRSPRAARSAADGSFRLTEMSAGVYSVLATSDRLHGELRDVALGVGDTRREIEILVDNAAQLRGTVSVGGERCSRATVSVRGGLTAQATADVEGNVTMNGLLPGSYSVEVSCDRALPLTETIEIGKEATTRVWNLEAGLRVRGTARSASGTPLPGARIDVDPREEDKQNGSCVTDQRGNFSCTGLVPGDYDCTIAGPAERRSAAVRVSLPTQANDWIELRAEPAGAIRARIDGPEQLERNMLPLLAYRNDAAPVFGRWEADALVFEPLGLGSYELRSDTAPPGSGTSAELTYDGQVQEVRLTFAMHRLTGRVVDSAGMAMPDVWVRAESASQYALGRPPSTPVLSDEWGGFALSGLMPGRYRVTAISRTREAHTDAETNSADVLVRFERQADEGVSLDSAPHAMPR